MEPKNLSKLGLLAALAAGAFATGCSAMSTNDNPISTEKMAEIRAKEGAQRGNMSKGGPPVGGTTGASAAGAPGGTAGGTTGGN